MALSVQSVSEAWTRVRKLTEEAGGFVASSSSLGADDDGPSAFLELKIPAERLDAVMESVAALGRIRERSEQAEDVTGQYLDMEARLRNLQREEARLLEILQKSGNVKDLLEVERELARVRGEIEHLQSDLKHIDERVAYSTLTVRLMTSSTAATGSGFWDVGETVGNAWHMFRVLLISLVRGAIYLAFLMPFIAPFWIWRRMRARRKMLQVDGALPEGESPVTVSGVPPGTQAPPAQAPGRGADPGR